MESWDIGIKGGVILRIDRGEDVLRTIKSAIKKHGLDHALVVSACGSLDQYSYHAVASPNYPPGDYYRLDAGSFQIQAIQGLIVDAEPHLHIIMSSREGAFGGHMELGCRALTQCEVVILRLEDIGLTWKLDAQYPDTGIRHLEPK